MKRFRMVRIKVEGTMVTSACVSIPLLPIYFRKFMNMPGATKIRSRPVTKP